MVTFIEGDVLFKAKKFTAFYPSQWGYLLSTKVISIFLEMLIMMNNYMYKTEDCGIPMYH